MKLFRFFRRTYVPPVPQPGTETIGARQLIIRSDMLPGSEGANINVPSVIRVPDWIERPLGRYYLYFASHSGARHIRFAAADRMEGPWRIVPSGVLVAADMPEIGDHVAAPDVHVDDERRQIRMYFHAQSRRQNRTGALVALSTDGRDFRVQPEILGAFYFRAFRHDGAWYALSKGGRLYRSVDGLSSFDRGPDVFPRIPWNGRRYNAPGSARHVAIEVTGQHAAIYYSRIGDAPERILKSRMDIGGPWRTWRAEPPEDVMRPELPWEGADLPVAPSQLGAARRPVHQLRDPEVFTDSDGARYLLYAVAGEQGIAVARLGPIGFVGV